MPCFFARKGTYICSSSEGYREVGFDSVMHAATAASLGHARLAGARDELHKIIDGWRGSVRETVSSALSEPGNRSASNANVEEEFHSLEALWPAGNSAA